MKMEKKQFRIGELADRLQVERFVIRFWEKEFELSGSRSSGKQRFYDEDDYVTFSTIKQLLYQEKFTISGAKKQLSATKKNLFKSHVSVGNTHVLSAEKTTLEETAKVDVQAHIAPITKQLIQLRKKLIKLQELL